MNEGNHILIKVDNLRGIEGRWWCPECGRRITVTSFNPWRETVNVEGNAYVVHAASMSQSDDELFDMTLRFED